MEMYTANIENLLAEALCYPGQQQLSFLENGIEMISDSPQKKFLLSFVEKIRPLSAGEWEELYTRTLDLNPPAAPYIGFQTWGESYQRGAFLSKMNRTLLEAGIDLQGELPDHLIPVLRYLGQVAEPLPELIEVLGPAVERITSGLRKADPGNPYLDLLEAIKSLYNALEKETK